MYEELWKTITTGRVWTGELLNKHKNGTFFWEKAHIAPVTNENRVTVSFVAVKEDITERKRREESCVGVRRVPGHVRGGLATGSSYVTSNNYLDANPRLLGMLGYTLDEFRKLKNENLIHPKILQPIR